MKNHLLVFAAGLLAVTLIMQITALVLTKGCP